MHASILATAINQRNSNNDDFCRNASTHYSGIIMSAVRLKLPGFRLFTQSSVQEQIKENMQGPRHWSLWGEFTGDRWIHRPKGQ